MAGQRRIDLDDLKVVNDREGHAQADRMRSSLAATMREAFRETDRLFRTGGDEFAVIMPGTEPDDAVTLAGRLHHYCTRRHRANAHWRSQAASRRSRNPPATSTNSTARPT